MDWIEVFICATGLAGHVLIARQDKRGYWFWIAGNIAIIKLSIADTHFGMAGLFLTYTVISLHALRTWGRNQESPHREGFSKRLLHERLKSLLGPFSQGDEEYHLHLSVHIKVRS